MVGCNGHDALGESYLRSALRTFTNLLFFSFRYETWFDPGYVAFEFVGIVKSVARVLWEHILSSPETRRLDK